MDALAKGFCAASLVQSLTPTEMETWRQQWPRPTLQVVDIQRYPCRQTAISGPSRFYVAVSDTESVAWLVVPPFTALEDSFAAFEIEIGSCITLLSHVLVTAANGVNVVVPLSARHSNNTHRLLGQPKYDKGLFQLSMQSLFQRHDVGKRPSSAAAPALQRPSHKIAIRDFVDAPQQALGNWCVTARVIWRGCQYPLNPQGGRAGYPSATHSGVSASGRRFLLRCLLADEHGDAILGTFVGGETLMERMRLHGCYRLARGVVKWGTGENGAPVELHFVEKSIEEEMGMERTQMVFPYHASSLIGEIAKQLHSVATVIETVEIGGCVSVVGTVVAVQENAQINTKRGRVWRSVVTLADGEHQSSRVVSSSCFLLDVTLWGDVAEAVAPALGERWLFHLCTVQFFQRRKVLSSRSSTMAVRLIPRKEMGRQERLASASSPEIAHRPRLDADSDANLADDTVLAAPTGRKDMQFVLDLHEASPTLPLLVRVQDVVSPLLTWVCAECSRSQHESVAVDNTATAIPTACAYCSAIGLCPTLHMSVWLSDCLCTFLGDFYGRAAESLLEASPVEVVQYQQQSSPVLSEMVHGLVGSPILVWLLPCGLARGSDAPQFIVVKCKRFQYIFGSYTLLSAIDTFAATDEDVNNSPAGLFAKA